MISLKRPVRDWGRSPVCLAVGCQSVVGSIKCFCPICNPFKGQSFNFVGCVLTCVATGKRKCALGVVAANFDPLPCGANIFFCESCHLNFLKKTLRDCLGLDASYHGCDALQGLLQLFFTFFLGSFPSACHHTCDIVRGMNILEIALLSAGGVGRLAYILDLKQNVISNWKMRGSVPKGWETVLRIKFAKQIAAVEKVG